MANPDFQLADWIVRTQRCCIERADELRRIKPKSMQVLEVLARARGGVVSRIELFDTIWPGQAVTDDALTGCIVELRKAFDDSPRNPQVIETIPKKGFRIVADVEPIVDESTAPRASFFSTRLAGMLALPLLAIVVAWLGINRIETSQTLPIDGLASVAVLPFIDMSPDGDQEYFADGLSEELINRLTQIQDLQVTGRTSSFYFKGRTEDLRSIGEQLSVKHVLGGSVRKSDDRLRITAQLTDVSSGFQLWSDTYDRQYEDIFVVQQDIAESVATALSIKLSVGEAGNFKGGTNNVAAFEAAMLGNTSHHKLTAEATLQAIKHLQEATRLDPDFALAWERLANAYRTAWLTLGDDDTDMWGRLADEAIARALVSAPDSKDVLRTAAYIQVDRQNWAEAHCLFDEILALDPPGDPKESGAYLDILAKTGHIDKALRRQERCRRFFWIPLTRSLRDTQEFRSIVRSIGLVDYWRQYGWNDNCEPLGEADFRCS